MVLTAVFFRTTTSLLIIIAEIQLFCIIYFHLGTCPTFISFSIQVIKFIELLQL